MSPRLRLVHVVYSFSVGGLENIIVQLINRLPADRFEHVLLSLTTIGDFAQRIERPGVQLIALGKGPGHAVPLYPKIWRLFRQLKPDVVHTCNLAALEVLPLAWAAGVPRRIHAEHGWDAHDPQGRNPKYQRLRRLYRPFVSHYVSVSKDLDNYLAAAIGVPDQRRSLVANGVDTDVFRPAETGVAPQACPFDPVQHWLVGTVGRLQTVKNQPFLAAVFVMLLAQHPEAAARARLVLVGEGPLRAEVERILAEGGVSHLAWLPGMRHDVATILQSMSCFVLPSLTEGTSCTLQEAMATGLPTVATAVGGTPDLVTAGQTGQLVQPGDVAGMAQALWVYLSQPALALQHGTQARAHALQRFALTSMIQRYDALFSAQI
ncbi:TIGR03088 family PEP-CTERM/XrtA system glycosyltransferase [Rhodoferax sp. BLA1]|uniref:TIGR03088 family PEP-CTERM/XrtA system glycosyltransferase n=1 Tax=Rhodoferax sp. BLA1 TaxID=2576062 RepID=UPI0015D19128|nr:TIGR03088 family PEP-CTERM/XrtA system glycosyltransferase [Rhodoferax sp. BLA1]